jgi:hypothetical protein
MVVEERSGIVQQLLDVAVRPPHGDAAEPIQTVSSGRPPTQPTPITSRPMPRLSAGTMARPMRSQSVDSRCHGYKGTRMRNKRGHIRVGSLRGDPPHDKLRRGLQEVDQCRGSEGGV